VLRGREVLSRATRDMNDEAQDMFQRAIALDPSYAAAYAGLGGTYYEAVVSGWTEFRGEELERAENLAQKALALDPASTSAYRLLALIDLSKGRYDFALGQIDHALELNPSDAESYLRRGSILLFSGRSSEALPWLKGALRLDPDDGLATLHLGMAYYFLDRYGEAVEAMDRALAGDLGRLDKLMGRPVLAAAYAQLNRPQDAERERTSVMRIEPFLDAEQFAAQFGTQAARDKVMDGLKKAGFR
jgi:adenylate cyclase